MIDKNIALLAQLFNENSIDEKTSCFIEMIGPTLIGVKPATLINIKLDSCLLLCQTICDNSNELGYTVIKRYKSGAKIFIYHIESLKQVLSKKDVAQFLKSLGYPEFDTVNQYINFVLSKIKSNDFPHEIGIFFGYPLDDVYGFMGGAVPYRKTMGWRMYGDLGTSEKIYSDFENARTKVRNIIQMNI